MRLALLLPLWRLLQAEKVHLTFLFTLLNVQIVCFFLETAAYFNPFHNIRRWNIFGRKVLSQKVMDLCVKRSEILVCFELIIYVSVSVLVEELSVLVVDLDEIHNFFQ